MAIQSQYSPSASKVPTGLECNLERIKQEFLEQLSSRGKDHSLDSKDLWELLTTFYRPGRLPSGLIAQTRQKILVVKTSAAEKGAVVLANGDSVKVNYGDGKFLQARVIRVSEYPNADGEFKTELQVPISTTTILIEWENETGTDPQFIGDLVKSLYKGEDKIEVMGQADQADNFIINPVPPNSEPDPPIQSLVLGSGLLELPVAKGDYSVATYKIIDGPWANVSDAIKVVVSDTGLKFKLQPKPPHTYDTWDGLTTHFPIAPNPTPTDPNPVGFCSLTNYLDDNYPLPPPRDVSFPNGIPNDDRKVLRNPHDDHHGRHGTCIAAIVAQNPAGASAIIPLKIFDFLGLGTLFDVLCGFNYIFSRIEAGENIRIVNASWGAAVPENNFAVYELLEKKIAVLQKKNVFVLAAAGNRTHISQTIGHNLSTGPAVPACYSANYDNVITVTTVAEKWKKCLFNRKKRSHYINQELHNRTLASNNLLEKFLNLIYNIVPNGYTAVENYSPKYVGVGVVAHPLAGIFPTPFGGGQQLPIAGSSFATAFMTAYVVSFLKNNPGATRAQILASLCTHSSLNTHVDQGRYLELSTVTGASVEANFESVLHAILSTIT